eukprot:1162080-Pelagomonas_calceolata.AAC.14
MAGYRGWRFHSRCCSFGLHLGFCSRGLLSGKLRLWACERKVSRSRPCRCLCVRVCMCVRNDRQGIQEQTVRVLMRACVYVCVSQRQAWHPGTELQMRAYMPVVHAVAEIRCGHVAAGRVSKSRRVPQNLGTLAYTSRKMYGVTPSRAEGPAEERADWHCLRSQEKQADWHCLRSLSEIIIRHQNQMTGFASRHHQRSGVWKGLELFDAHSACA